jgi:hypothetical protein
VFLELVSSDVLDVKRSESNLKSEGRAITQISKEISRCYPKVVKQSEILLKVDGCLLILFVVKYPMKYGTFLTIYGKQFKVRRETHYHTYSQVEYIYSLS